MPYLSKTYRLKSSFSWRPTIYKKPLSGVQFSVFLIQIYGHQKSLKMLILIDVQNVFLW